MLTFTALDRYRAGKCDVIAVALDRETSDFAHLTDQTVSIDGQAYRVLGIERFIHSPPWRKGEHVGLAVEPVP